MAGSVVACNKLKYPIYLLIAHMIFCHHDCELCEFRIIVGFECRDKVGLGGEIDRRLFGRVKA